MKKFLTWFSIGVILFAGVFACITMSGFDRTYSGPNAPVSVYDLQQNPESYDDSNPNGAADAIVQQDLSKTHAVNDVTSIVFDFRGYDTMGEAFILITAVAGSIVILSNKKKKEDDDK
jgi:Multisubunit Na+/H+ antiporter, MnhB subunit